MSADSKRAPVRMLDDPAMDAEVKEALKAAAEANIDPPAGAKDAVWSAVCAGIGAGGAGGAGGAAGAGNAGGAAGAGGAASAGWGAASAVLPSILIGAASAGLVIGGYLLVSQDGGAGGANEPTTVVEQPSASISSTFEDNPIQLTPAPLGSGPGGAEIPGAKAHFNEISPNSIDRHSNEWVDTSASAAPAERAGGANQMVEESRRMGEARAALRGGDAAKALALLNQLQQRFPKAMLYQEREALAIEALYKSGRKSEAAARARAFMDRFPNSPFSHRAANFLQ